jgi:hypothetical protein
VFKECFWPNRFCRLGEDLPSRLSTKVCQDSGKLHLGGWHWSSCVRIPDLRCFANLSSTYQITSFSLVVEGKWRTSTQSAEANYGRLPNSPVAWSTLLKGLVFKKEPSNVRHTMCISKYSMLPASKTLYSHQGKLVQAILVG